MKKALIIGDKNCLPYKSVTALENTLPGIFGCEFDTADETKYGSLCYEDIKDYDMVVFKPADWAKTGTLDLAVALFTYVLHGGNILAMGEGLNPVGQQELKILFTSRFKAVAPYTLADFVPTGADTELLNGVETVSVREMPMMFDMDIFKKTTVLMNVKYGNAEYPAAWAHPWSKGKIACLAAGIDSESINAFAPLLKNIGKWFMA